MWEYNAFLKIMEVNIEISKIIVVTSLRKRRLKLICYDVNVVYLDYFMRQISLY